ncbi:MAG TPA: hypothetical protein DDX29_12075 [Clostridiales bacterium]|nr:hypothetical protein [Clostridiales bacterium]
MRKIIIYLIIVLLACTLPPPPADAGMLQGICGGGSAAAPACGEVSTQETQDGQADVGVDATNDRWHVAGNFSGLDGSIKQISVYIKRYSTATQTITLSLCTDNSGNPSSTCTAADATLDASTLTTSFAWKTFNIAAGYNVSSANTYWIKLSASAISATAYVIVGYNAATTGAVKYSSDGSSWGNIDSSAQIDYKLNTCAP